MILRDATVSDLRTKLPHERTEHVAEPRPEYVSEARLLERDEPRRERAAEQSVSPRISSDAHASVPPRREPELTFERVAAWLAVQDGETRTACASLLADELTEVHEAAKAEGHSLGRSEGRKAAEQELQQRLGLLQGIASEAEAAFEAERDALADACVDVIAEAFVKLAGTELATRAAIRAVVLEVLKRVRDGRELTVRLNARDLAALDPHESALQEALAGRSLRLTADPRIEIGGCVVESGLGSLDGRLEVQLRALFETLKAAKHTTEGA